MTKLTLEESLIMFMAEIAKRHDENSNLIKEIQASTDFALRNQKASIKALEIQVRQMSIILHKKLFRNLQSSTNIKPRGNDEMISTFVKIDKPSIRRIDASQYAETGGEKDLEAHCTNAKPLGKALPRKEKDRGSFTLPCFINNMCFNKALANSGASVSVMPYSTYTTLGLGDLIPIKLVVKLADRTVKRPKGIVENVLVEVRLMGNALRKNRSHDPKFEDFLELYDLNEPLELRHDQVVDLGPTIEECEVIDAPIKEMVKTRHDDDKITNGIEDYPSFSNLDRKIRVNDAYNLRFFCMIGYEHVDNFFPLLSINMMSKRFYNSIMKDKLEFRGKSVVGAFMNAPIFVGTFSVVIDFAVIENMDRYCNEEMGNVIVGKEFFNEIGVKAKWFEGMITINNGNEEVTYQMALSHPRFKHHTNEQCNKILPLLKVSEVDSMNGISHSYKKLKGFYKGVLNLGPEYVRDAKMEE
ncbi:homeodomain-like protein [Tanacetum coccineum]